MSDDAFDFSYPIGNLHNYGLDVHFSDPGILTLFVYTGFLDIQAAEQDDEEEPDNGGGGSSSSSEEEVNGRLLHKSEFQGARFGGLSEYLDSNNRMYIAVYQDRIVVLKEPSWEGTDGGGNFKFSTTGAFLNPISPNPEGTTDNATHIAEYEDGPSEEELKVGDFGKGDIEFRMLYVLKLSDERDYLISTKKIDTSGAGGSGGGVVCAGDIKVLDDEDDWIHERDTKRQPGTPSGGGGEEESEEPSEEEEATEPTGAFGRVEFEFIVGYDEDKEKFIKRTIILDKDAACYISGAGEKKDEGGEEYDDPCNDHPGGGGWNDLGDDGGWGNITGGGGWHDGGGWDTGDGWHNFPCP